MKAVYVLGDNIVSPLGFTTAENFFSLCDNISGVKEINDISKSDKPFFASLFDEAVLQEQTTGIENYPKFEQLLLRSIKGVLANTKVDAKNTKTGFILSSTKGNISLLERYEITEDIKEQISLNSSAKKIAAYLQLQSTPVIVSHACISGLVALITAKRMLEAGMYENIIVSGADIITKFILSGFQSFQAVSDELCQPFDANRKGINLGEAAATIILSINKPQGNHVVQLCGGAISNDANHISGPSRTGEELFQAIEAALSEAGIEAGMIDFISAHGTATIYNDDMESKALALAGMQLVPVNSLKGYYGHTLGAAGLLESVISIQSMRENKIIPTKGFSKLGTEKDINVCSTLQSKKLKSCLKTASGFGGCNAAVVFKKI